MNSPITTSASRLPSAKSASSEEVRPRLRAAIEQLGLAGLANDTKWDRLISEIRGWTEWRPSYRWCALDTGFVSRWDVEWFYHLPFPFIGVRWFEISCTQQLPALGGRYSPDHLRLPRIISHRERLTKLICDIGFTFRIYGEVIRIFGYAPLDETNQADGDEIQALPANKPEPNAGGSGSGPSVA